MGTLQIIEQSTDCHELCSYCQKEKQSWMRSRKTKVRFFFSFPLCSWGSEWSYLNSVHTDSKCPGWKSFLEKGHKINQDSKCHLKGLRLMKIKQCKHSRSSFLWRMLNEVSEGDWRCRSKQNDFCWAPLHLPLCQLSQGHLGSSTELEQAAPTHEQGMGREELAQLQRHLESPSLRYWGWASDAPILFLEASIQE